jgi:hypothetical protein
MSFHSHRLKNIEETERAKRAMMEAKRTTYKPTRQEQEENYATARCEPFLQVYLLLDLTLVRSSQSIGPIIKSSRMRMH